MRRAPLLLFALASAAGALSIAPPKALADIPAARIAKLLSRPDKPHPLASQSLGRIPLTVAIPPGASASDYGLLEVTPTAGVIHLTPNELDAFTAAFPELSPMYSPPKRALLERSQEWTRAASFRNDTGLDGSGVAIGIVDTGIDIAHPDFRDENGKTRIAWMITLEAPRGVHADLEALFQCDSATQQQCAIYSADDINAILESGQEHTLHDPAGHGTHVASIAAGNGGPMLKLPLRFVGVAPGASLIVASPTAAGEGFRDGNILTAVNFIFNRAEAMKMPAAINLSIGGDFGPHDGTSTLERELANMVGDDKPGRALILAGGNSGTLYHLANESEPYGIHTEAHVAESAETRVPMLTAGAKRGQAFVWITFRLGDEVSVGLEGPGGETLIGLTDPGTDRGYYGDKLTAGVINNTRDGKAPIEAGSNSAVVYWEGEWQHPGEFTVLLKGRGDAQLWVTGLGDASPSNGLGILFRKAIKQGTITVPASHPSLLAVGCMMNRISWAPYTGPAIKLTKVGDLVELAEDSPCYFSSAGPTPLGIMKPEISAPGGFVAAAMSAEADPRKNPGGLFDTSGCPDPLTPCAVVDDHHAIAAGSSMASPHVAGAAALLFAVNPKLTQAQVIDILQAGARYPTAAVPHETQLGAGTLDLNGALQALALEDPSPAEPSIEKSWYVLSSSYARPDPTWPVWGTVELRRPDGSVASGLAGSKLELRVSNGLVVQPLAKVRHGLFRFAVAGNRGMGGSSMTVDVLYDGQSLGARTLSIGTDVWTAGSSGVDAEGGISCGISGNGGDLKWLSALGFLALSAGARRRRDSSPSKK
ncbi:MAG: S8 family serine peptidase [Polyangiaceae bacterium]|nr:S8 family serine peptidase [Polyangiaceae bacterium]